MSDRRFSPEYGPYPQYFVVLSYVQIQELQVLKTSLFLVKTAHGYFILSG